MSIDQVFKAFFSFSSRYVFPGIVLALSLSIAGCQVQPKSDAQQLLEEQAKQDPSKLLIVDCLLPAQVRKLGSKLTYLAQRRPIKTSALDCEIRGGEYVAYDRADYRTALNVWLPRAKEGDPEAQTYVGEIYEKGLGIQADYKTAAAWYRKAAEQNNSRAQINLGFLYEKGLGVEKDLAKSLNYYRMASGIDDDSLQYTSTIVATAETQQELETLKTEVAQQKQESKTLKQQLKVTRTELSKQKKALSAEEKVSATLRKKVQQQKAVSSSTQGAGTTQLSIKLGEQEAKVEKQRQQIAQLEKDLNQQQSELSQQLASERKKSDALKTELKKQQDKVSTLNKKLASTKPNEAPTIVAEGPSIEILDPPIALTRGLPSIRLRSATAERSIVGKVVAPAGLLSFTINDHREDVDQAGVFNTSIQVGREQVPVRLVAIDKLGQRASLDFMIIPQSRTISTIRAKASTPSPSIDKALAGKVDFGTYHALIIGNNGYQSYPGLETAVNDATEAEKVLREKYGFNTRMLIDANRYEILSVLNELRDQLTEKDNLLIYYAGHGELEQPDSRGHWLPIDAERQNSANWISNTSVTDMLNAMKAKHILVVADSCYSGSMSLSSVPRLDAESGEVDAKVKLKWLQVMAKVRSRTVLTSGGLQPVLDQGIGDHSVFASAFISTLKNNDGILEAYKLYRNLFGEVRRAANLYGVDQQPEYSAIKHGGHEAGEFIFVPVL